MAEKEKHSPTEMGKGQKTRQQILAVAADLASAKGLEGLTIGTLAKLLGMSKSGLYAHFGSKEDLQLAVIDLARQRFEATVLPPATQLPDGLPKILALLTSWADSIEHSTYRGGCFFAAASAEFDDRPGPVRDEIARLTKQWLDLLTQGFESARMLKQLKSRSDPAQMAFEVHAFVQEANWARQLLNDKQAFARARRSIRACLEREATAKGKKLISST
ncbi:MAG: TetR/AcrR family transcriptional regulator [Planctomycetaceae bacterium]